MYIVCTCCVMYCSYCLIKHSLHLVSNYGDINEGHYILFVKPCHVQKVQAYIYRGQFYDIYNNFCRGPSHNKMYFTLRHQNWGQLAKVEEKLFMANIVMTC